MRHDRLARFLTLVISAFWYLALGYTAWSVVPVAALLAGWQTPAERVLDLPISVAYGCDASSLPAGMITACGHSDIEVQADNAEIALGSAAVELVCVAGLAAIVYQLRLFLRKVAAGRPFEEGNPLRLRNIGILLAILGPMSGLWDTFVAHLYVGRIALPGAKLSVSVMLGWENVVIGLLLILVGQVLSAGVALQDEHDYTV